MSYLGQHFLKNKDKIKKMVKALKIEKGDLIIEIGPGHGEITKHLTNCQKCQIIAIEKDQKLASRLKIQNSKLKVIQGDALKTLPYFAHPAKHNSYKLIGNIPYYITGKLLRMISELKPKPKLTVLTLQKQVAERISAKPGKMNLLAAAVQIWAKPTIIAYISKNDFKPKPKIDSATIKLTTIATRPLTANYYKFIKILFKQPRKTILNNLAAGLKIPKKEINLRLKKLGLSPNARPQGLSIDKIKKMIDNINDK